VITAAVLSLAGMSERMGPPAPCIGHGALPDPYCTPGEHFAELSREDVCARGYVERMRGVHRIRKDTYEAILTNYARGPADDWVASRLIPASLGGTSGARNLVPLRREEAARKAEVDTALHAEVCSGRVTIADAQGAIARDWEAEYRRLVKERAR
jgi:hypothetical protein